ncbi:MAG: urease accessory protein UreF [Gammaproteobacteria bacterium]|nr:urease accessory protein UreF [Gammaproteobacteria bacterium]
MSTATAMHTITITNMTTDHASLYRLLSWLSPAYPVGAYTYSHGLEWVVESGAVRDAQALQAWLDGVLRFGGGRSDAILFAHAWRAAGDDAVVIELTDLAMALNPSAERRLETSAQGRAFLSATRHAWPVPALAAFDGLEPERLAYPVVVGVAAAGHDIPLPAALGAYLHAFLANLISAGVRLIPLGQSAGLALMAGFEATLATLADEASEAPLAGVGGCALAADLASIHHETQYSRLFRS